MPNVNFTSSSIAQQDRFAQTTVSYESRNMQSIPFYPDKNHTAKMRGIMATSIIICAIIGAIGGLIFGFRDYIFQALTPAREAGTAYTEQAPLPEDIKMSLASSTTYDIDIDASNKTVYYNGQPQMIEGQVKNDYGLTYTITHKYYKVGSDVSGATIVNDPKTEGPVNVGEYVVEITVSGENIAEKTERYFLTIKKADIENPGIKTPDGKNSVNYNATDRAAEFDVDGAIPSGCSYKITFSKAGKTVTEVKDAGVYTVTLTINSSPNYNKATFTQNFEIKKIDLTEHISKLAFPDTTVVYNGKSQTSALKIIPEKISVDVPEDLVEEIKNNPSIVEYTNIDAINVGSYTIAATINSKNYNPRTFEATLTITPLDISGYFDFNDTSVVYNKGNYMPSAQIFKHHIADGDLNPWSDVTVTYSYEVYNSRTAQYTEANEFINVGKYRVTAYFADRSPTGNYIVPATPITIEYTITKAAIDTSGITVDPIENVEYKNGSKIKFDKSYVHGELPEGVTIDFSEAYATDAGEHEVKIYFEGDNYERTFVNGVIKIDKSYFNVDISYILEQKVSKDGKLHAPVFTGDLPKGAEVAYTFNGESAAGVDRLGTYEAEIVIFDKNREARFPVTFTVTFNPLTIVLGIVVGVVVAIFIGFFTWLSEILIERKSFRKFSRLRARILHERGGARGAIVCEGRTFLIHTNSEMELRDFPWIPDPRFGRLYLTHATLEFYDSDYKNNYRNILIQLKEITGVEIRGGLLRNRLIVLYGRARQDFFVEPNTAYLWRRDILHFRNLAHLYPMENNVVDNDYPFNYDVITDGD
ncbi:MAG: hypothetical protein IJX92_04515 [Clostridia bacterium]|nr:hypothetical protein [Clostridia bacterium]